MTRIGHKPSGSRSIPPTMLLPSTRIPEQTSRLVFLREQMGRMHGLSNEHLSSLSSVYEMTNLIHNEIQYLFSPSGIIFESVSRRSSCPSIKTKATEDKCLIYLPGDPPNLFYRAKISPLEEQSILEARHPNLNSILHLPKGFKSVVAVPLIASPLSSDLGASRCRGIIFLKKHEAGAFDPLVDIPIIGEIGYRFANALMQKNFDLLL